MDIVTCPGTDTCKLGISSSRGLAAELRKRLAEKSFQFDEPCRTCTSRSAAASTVAASTTWPTWVFTASAARCRATRCRTSRWCWAASGRTTAAPTACRWWRFRPRTFRKWSTRLTDRYASDRKEGEIFKDFIKRIGKVEMKKMLEDLTRRRPIRRTAPIFTRLGRSARIQLGGHGHRRMRRRSGLGGRVRSGRRGTRSVRGAGGMGRRPSRAGGEDGLSGDAACRQGAGEARSPQTSRTIRTDRAANSARAITTRRNFSIRLRAANSRTICLPRTRNRSKPYTPDSARYLIDEAQLFIDAAHSCYNRLGHAGERLGVRESACRMELQHVNVKLHACRIPDAASSHLEPLIPVFHGWIQERRLANCCWTSPITGTCTPGPGVVLIGHEGDYSVDNTGQPPGRSLQSQGRGGRQ